MTINHISPKKCHYHSDVFLFDLKMTYDMIIFIIISLFYILTTFI